MYWYLVFCLARDVPRLKEKEMSICSKYGIIDSNLNIDIALHIKVPVMCTLRNSLYFLVSRD